MKNVLLLVALLVFSGAAGSARPAITAADLNGTWVLSVDLDNGAHGAPTFVFKQDKEILTGSYDGPLGQYKVTGTVNGNDAVFGFDFTTDGESHKATYIGKVTEPTKMNGTMEISDGPKGKWMATRK